MNANTYAAASWNQIGSPRPVLSKSNLRLSNQEVVATHVGSACNMGGAHNPYVGPVAVRDSSIKHSVMSCTTGGRLDGHFLRSGQ